MKKYLLLIAIVIMATNCSRNSNIEQINALLNTTPENINLANILKSKRLIMSSTNIPQDEIGQYEKKFANYILLCANNESNRANNTWDSLVNMNADSQAANDTLDSASARLKKYGICMYAMEGSIEAFVLPSYITETFKNYVTDDEIVASKLVELEMVDPSIIDAGLSISEKAISDRLKNCDLYIQKYPESKFMPDIKNLQKSYQMLIMYGVDNSPSFDMQTKRLDTNVKLSMQTYINEHPQLPSAKVFQDYLNLLQQNGYRYNKTINQYLRNLSKQK